MGFFSEIGRGLRNAKRAAFRGVGIAIDKLGDLFTSPTLWNIASNIELKNEIIKKPVDLEDDSASVEETIEFQKNCEDAQAQAALQAEKIEDDLIATFEKIVRSYTKAISNIFPDGLPAEFDYNEISLVEEFKKDIHNTVSDYVAVHISVDSETFVNLCKISDDSRPVKMYSYINTVLSKSLDEMKKKCKTKEIEIIGKIYAEISEYFDNEQSLIEETERNIKKLNQHIKDRDYCEAQAVDTIVTLSYLETMRTLTFDSI